jgi:hypothetical protein
MPGPLPVLNLTPIQFATVPFEASSQARPLDQERASIQADPLGEASLRHAVTQFSEHYHLEHLRQGKGNQLLFSSPSSPNSARPMSPTPRWPASSLRTPRKGLAQEDIIAVSFWRSAPAWAHSAKIGRLVYSGQFDTLTKHTKPP